MFKPVLKNPAKLMPLLAAFLFVQIQACKDEVTKMYSITYDLNGATGEIPAPQNYEVGGAGVNLANGTGLAQKGFAFGGWSEVKNGPKVTSPYTPKSNVILYAIWQPIPYTVTFDLNYGAGSTAPTPPTPQIYTSGDGLTLPTGADVTRAGYTLTGWATSATETTALPSPYTPTANVTLYAIWQPIPYTVTFDLNYGAGSTAPTPPTPQIYTSGDGLTLPTGADIIRPHYTFTGWATSATETTALPSPYTPTANVTLYAIWQPIPYTVTFDLNYGAGSTAPTPLPTPQIYTSGDGLTLPSSADIIARTYYTFTGWATSATETTAIASPYKPTADVTLYAIWQQMLLTSTSYRNGGVIPYAHTPGGGNISPQFSWTGAPPASDFAKFIIVFYDATIKAYHFRRAFDKDVSSLAEGAMTNRLDDYEYNYAGPAPDPGPPHTYEFKLYAVKAGYNIDNFGTGYNQLTGQKPQRDWATLEAENADYIVSKSAIYAGTYAYK